MPCVTCATRDQINNKLENMEYPLGVSVPVPVLISASTCLELEKLNLFLSLTFAIVPQRFTMKYFFSIFRFFFVVVRISSSLTFPSVCFTQELLSNNLFKSVSTSTWKMCRCLNTSVHVSCCEQNDTGGAGCSKTTVFPQVDVEKMWSLTCL